MVGPLKIQPSDITNKIDEFASELIDRRPNVRTKCVTIKRPRYGLHAGTNSGWFGEKIIDRGLYEYNYLAELSTMRRIRTPTGDMACSRFATRGISFRANPSISIPHYRTPVGLSHTSFLLTSLGIQYIDQSPNRRLYQLEPFHPTIMDFIGIKMKIGGKRKKRKICHQIEEMKRHIRNMAILYKLLDDNRSIDNLSLRLQSKFAILIHIKNHIRIKDLMSTKYAPNKGYDYASHQSYMKNIKNHYDMYPWMDMHHTKFGRYFDECLRLSSGSVM